MDVDEALLAMGRRRTPTPGQGNCMFNAVSAELVRLGRAGGARALAADDAVRHAANMARFPGIWQRTARRSRRRGGAGAGACPAVATGYPDFIREAHQWGTGFDLALLAGAMEDCRLIVLHPHAATPLVHLPAWSGRGPVTEVATALPTAAVAARSVLPADVVIAWRGEHYSACPPAEQQQQQQEEEEEDMATMKMREGDDRKREYTKKWRRSARSL